MSNTEWLERPDLRNPVAILAFEGWNDASDAASGAAEYLIELAGATPFASIDMEGYINYQISRPHVTRGPEGRTIHWPTTGFFALDLAGNSRDAVVVLGEEPHLRWQQFTRDIVEVLRGLGVSQTITLGAFIGQVPHTLPVPIFGDATEPELTTRIGLMQSNYEGPTGIIGVLHTAFRDIGFDAASLWAAIPHYLSANPSPKASLALLEKVGELLGYHIDLAELRAESADYEAQVADAVDESEEFIEYVRELEESADSIIDAPGGGEQLVEEIERYLRDSD